MNTRVQNVTYFNHGIMPHHCGKRKRLHRSKSAPPVLIRHSPIKLQKQWTNIQMEKAMKAVTFGVGINRAEMEHGVPQTTHKNCISGRIEYGMSLGPVPYLNKGKKKDLAEFVKKSASMAMASQENKSWLLQKHMPG